MGQPGEKCVMYSIFVHIKRVKDGKATQLEEIWMKMMACFCSMQQLFSGILEHTFCLSMNDRGSFV